MVRRPVVYQAFKFDVVAHLNGDGFRLTSEAVDRWYQAWRTAHPDQVAREEDRRRLDAEIAALDALERADQEEPR
jgi:hypothetical protein